MPRLMFETTQPVATSDGSPKIQDRVCVVGAGTSGLAVAKNLKQRGMAFDCYERADAIGGNWYYGQPASSVYRSTHLISSKELTEYTDFPMPEHYPEFPHHRLVWDYLDSYAKHFDLYDDIRLKAGIKRITSASVESEGGAKGWIIETDDGQRRGYSKLVIANGHNWDPRWPEFPGTFDGIELHSSDYKVPEALAGKRVLVVGAGNSGCDIAVEAAQNAKSTAISLRRGYHFLPKFFHGTPIDVCGERMLRWRLPLTMRRLLAATASFFVLGLTRPIGLPKPDHRLFETHPIINSQLIYHVRHGDIEVLPNVAELKGDAVRFEDGREEPFDVIVYATGFKISFPFIDRAELNWQADRPELYLNIFHPQRDDLFVAGLIQPDSGQWGLVDYQAQLITNYLQGLQQGRRSAQWFQQRKRQANERVNGGVQYINSPRHLLEVEHFSYGRKLKRLVRKLRR